ncbi:MAG: hypothetical protein WC656_03270 [Sulfurimonas sp.]|jgi:lysozyme
MTNKNLLLNSIKEHEGFNGHMYFDSMGLETIGYGTLLPLTTFEAEQLLLGRLGNMIMELHNKIPLIKILPEQKQIILYEMAYQLGVNGLSKFKNMFDALDKGHYITASLEMLDSKWAKYDSPNRAKELANKMMLSPENISDFDTVN